jgi:hypothetical protein
VFECDRVSVGDGREDDISFFEQRPRLHRLLQTCILSPALPGESREKLGRF